MVTRITAEFESPESAELALKRIRENIRGVYSTSYVYNKQSDKAERIRGKDIYTIMPTAAVTQNYLTAVMDSPASVDSIPEPSRSRKTTVFIVCDGSGTSDISSVLSNSGAVNIDSPAI
ncbi:MAG: hypothetical protein J6B01_10125 [Ruminococcus sp.]|nr:hypothetical protein [Ruminococcus sp.]MBP3379594.1 hypothetical protein [Ruminococcus sp.]